MKIEYENTKADVLAFNEHVWRTSPALRRQYRLGFAVAPLTGLLATAVVKLLIPALPVWVALVVFVAAAAVFVPLYQGLALKTLRKTVLATLGEGKNQGVLTRHELELTPQELRERTEVGESRHKWSGIERVEATPDYILIFTQTTAAHLIPRRAFPKPDAADAFLEEATQLWRDAQGSGA